MAGADGFIQTNLLFSDIQRATIEYRTNKRELKPEPLNFDLFNSSIEALKENPIDFVSNGKGKSFFKACVSIFCNTFLA